MDVHVEFKPASQDQASELFRRFYAPENAAGRRTEGVPSDGQSDKDSGYFTPPRDKKLVDAELPEGEVVLLPSHQNEHGLAELALLSEKFKENIPDRDISMAALQGYLMMHKGRPHDAVEFVGVWVQGEKAKAAKGTGENPISGRARQRTQGQVTLKTPTKPRKYPPP